MINTLTDIELVYLKNKDKILKEVGLPCDFYDYMSSSPKLLAGVLKEVVRSSIKQKEEERKRKEEDEMKEILAIELPNIEWLQDKTRGMIDMGFSEFSIKRWYYNELKLMKLLEEHPCYNGKFQIKFNSDYQRRAY